ncbi:lysine--tRNA ligase [Acuticoccus sp. MNP-M23]|uniref:lysine--tRNA ligase n=1 Tax=Acuticoccus sp. MNP-M23 TaxID=3072793 RepID=UPI00281604DC|nr:lysine--tRNA ligase [Acuticoccus sp. MNP-M23]WMS44497.1 lysine--tRNA ligase [Acuticoccus sp. MNP-M23]
MGHATIDAAIDPDALARAKSWPFEEARKVVARLGGATRPVVFETGYGPSGLPHIGTFGEVARTTMVRNAFTLLTGGTIPSSLVAFSDDMDGLRKIPTNLPNRERLEPHLGKPLTEVPDPFGTHESFAHHNNARLRGFLDGFGFEYTFMSATETYRSGRFDEALLATLRAYDDVMAIMLPSLGAERQATYSPFLPIHPVTRVVMQVPLEGRDADAGTIVWRDPADGKRYETPVTGGAAKLQWKPDWAMRWAALGVDYEMAGKDLIESVRQSSRICKAIGGTPPEGFNYELFLDENGEKISKSKGNGLSVEEWLTYASPESLSLFMFQKPRAAKRLFFDVIPKAVDEYFSFAGKYNEAAPADRLDSPVFHIKAGAAAVETTPISFAMLLNLVSASNASERAVLWGFISRYAPDATSETEPQLDRLVGYALSYYRDFVAPTKAFRDPTATERAAIEALSERIAPLEGADGETIQNEVYAVGKEHFDVLRDWFGALYQVLLGQQQGPRFGSFIALYGVPETRALIAQRLGAKPEGA